MACLAVLVMVISRTHAWAHTLVELTVALCEETSISWTVMMVVSVWGSVSWLMVLLGLLLTSALGGLMLLAAGGVCAEPGPGDA